MDFVGQHNVVMTRPRLGVRCASYFGRGYLLFGSCIASFVLRTRVLPLVVIRE